MWTEFDAIKNLYFPAARLDTHHYVLFAHKYNGGTSSGISRGIPASDFIVSLGGWGSNPGTPDEQTGTFIHELGHNIGLTHGGNDHVNYKPNYLSIMNYFFQTSGLYRSGAWGNFDYQRISSYSLNELALNESNGIGPYAYGYGTKWTCPDGSVRTSTVYKPIDWNCNGAIDPGTVSTSINNDVSKQTLGSQLNWEYIVYDGGTIGGITSEGKRTQIQMAEEMPVELTFEENEENKKSK